MSTMKRLTRSQRDRQHHQATQAAASALIAFGATIRRARYLAALEAELGRAGA